MIFYKVNNISIGRFAEMTNNKRLVMRWNIPLPEKWITKVSNRLIADFNKLNGKEDMAKLIEGYHKLSMVNRMVNILPTIFLGFQVCYKMQAITGEKSPYFEDFEKLFEETRGFKPTEADILGIPKFIEKLKNKYDDLFEDEPQDVDTDFDFNYYVFTLERILAPMEIRSKKLTQLSYYNKMAIKLQKNPQMNKEAEKITLKYIAELNVLAEQYKKEVEQAIQLENIKDKQKNETVLIRIKKEADEIFKNKINTQKKEFKISEKFQNDISKTIKIVLTDEQIYRIVKSDYMLKMAGCE